MSEDHPIFSTSDVSSYNILASKYIRIVRVLLFSHFLMNDNYEKKNPARFKTVLETLIFGTTNMALKSNS